MIALEMGPSGLQPNDVELCGHLCRARLCDGLSLEETLHAAGSIVPLHAHDRDVALFVAEGSMVDQRLGAAHELPAGSVFFVPAGIPHSARVGSQRARVLSIEFDAKWMAMVGMHLPAPLEAIRIHTARAAAHASALRDEFNEQDAATPLVISGLAMALLGEIARGYRAAPEFAAPWWLREARTRLQSRALTNVRLSDIAAEVGVHPVHLSRAFRRHFGLRMSSFLSQHRVELARRALLATDQAVGTIGIEAGFCDHGHFTRVFRRYVNASPSAYRARRRAIAQG